MFLRNNPSRTSRGHPKWTVLRLLSLPLFLYPSYRTLTFVADAVIGEQSLHYEMAAWGRRAVLMRLVDEYVASLLVSYLTTAFLLIVLQFWLRRRRDRWATFAVVLGAVTGSVLGFWGARDIRVILLTSFLCAGLSLTIGWQLRRMWRRAEGHSW